MLQCTNDQGPQKIDSCKLQTRAGTELVYPVLHHWLSTYGPHLTSKTDRVSIAEIIGTEPQNDKCWSWPI
jgi:hypothetical protein